MAMITHQWWPTLPDLSILLTLLIVSLLLVSLLFFVRRVFCVKIQLSIVAYLIGILMGCIVVSSAATIFHQKTLTALSISTDTIIAGKVDSLFIPQKGQTSVLFDIDTINGRKLNSSERFKAKLYWRTQQDVRQGQLWQITARLREPYGRVNEAGFDAQTYYLSRHIHAKGSVLTATLLNPATTLRQRLLEKVYVQIEDLPHVRFLIALAFGDKGLLTQDDWIGLRNTGLAHLLAISGLHIGLAFMFGFTLSKMLQPLFTAHPRHFYGPVLVGFLCAFGYVWAAGFSLTAQRAFIAILLFMLIRQKGYSIGPFHVFLWVLCAVLIIDPFSVFSASFWLSFWAVFVLCVLGCFLPPIQKTKRGVIENIKRYFFLLFKVQCFLIIGMFPIMYLWFDGVSVNAIWFNMWALPLVSFVTVPLILLALICSPFFSHNVFWFLADVSLSPLYFALKNVDSGWLPLGDLNLAFPFMFVFFFFVCYLLKGRQFPFLVGILALSLLLLKSETPEKTQWRVDVFDVGHGLAVLIESNGKAVLYDTGSAWGSGNIAQRVIEPVLNARGTLLEGLILSHNDNDHAGGEAWVREYLSPHWVRSSKTGEDLPCIKGRSWQWQHLRFEVLFPQKRVLDPGNEDSCVIRVSDGTNAILLTGDIPKGQEKRMLEDGALLKSDVLLVAHHGSKTSSSKPFIEAVNPGVAIVSTGRYTPWNLPHPDVRARFKAQNIRWYETAKQGQISVFFSKKGWSVSSKRSFLEPFWFRKMFGSGIRTE